MSYVFSTIQTNKLADVVDISKSIVLDFAGSTASTSVTIQPTQGSNIILTLPNSSTTLVGTNISQTLTNKTIDATSNTLVNVLLTYSDQTSSGTKTFSSPIRILNDSGLVLFDGPNSFSTTVQSSTSLVADITLRLPDTIGGNGQMLQSDGANNTLWTYGARRIFIATDNLTTASTKWISIIPTGIGSLQIARSTIRTGTTIMFRLNGVFSSDEASKFIAFRALFQSETSLIETPQVQVDVNDSAHIVIDGAITIRDFKDRINAIGDIHAVIDSRYNTPNLVGTRVTVPVDIDPGLERIDFDLQFMYASESGANNLTITNAVIWRYD
jgi:hypothetical protein